MRDGSNFRANYSSETSSLTSRREPYQGGGLLYARATWMLHVEDSKRRRPPKKNGADKKEETDLCEKTKSYSTQEIDLNNTTDMENKIKMREVYPRRGFRRGFGVSDFRAHRVLEGPVLGRQLQMSASLEEKEKLGERLTWRLGKRSSCYTAARPCPP